MVIFGIPFHASWLFWVIMAILGRADQARTPDQWLNVGLFMLAGTVSIGLHELGHALVGRKFGARNPWIELHGMGGLCRFQSARFTRWQDFLVSGAGPAANFILALLFGTLILVFGDRTREMVGVLMGHFLWVNLVWGIFNLMPIHPLDGGQMLRAALGPQRLRLTFLVSIVTASVLLAPLLYFGGGFTAVILILLIWDNLQNLNATRR